MDRPQHRQYELERRLTKMDYNEVNRRITFTLTPAGETVLPKKEVKDKLIYVVRGGSTFLYIGETEKNIADRFDQSFKYYRQYHHSLSRGKEKKRGNAGYKWIEMMVERDGCVFQVDTFVFDGSVPRELIQAIEAEIVFAIRLNTGKWPLKQHEIHFFEEHREKISGVCRDVIFPKLGIQLDSY